MTGRPGPAISGNADLVRFLLGLAGSSSLGHAYLFCGPDGVGKKLASLEFARAVNCRCGAEEAECDSCRLIRSLRHPELLILEDLTKPRWISRSEVMDDDDADSNGSYGEVIQRAFEGGYIEEPLPRAERQMRVDGFRLVTDKLFGHGSVPSRECYTPGPVSETIRKAFDSGEIGKADHRLLRRLYEYPLSLMPYRGAIPIAYIAERKGWKFIRPIQPFLSVRSMLEGRKIVIIDDAHKMTAEAQNCLLKTLEEPPADSLIILIASDRQALFQTIVSRCQVVSFGRLAGSEMEAFVAETVGCPDDGTRLVKSLAENSPGRFLELAMYDMTARLDDLKGFFTGLVGGNLAGALGLAGRIMEQGGSHRRQQRRMVTEALELTGFWIAQVLRVKAGLEDTLGIPAYSEALKQQAGCFDRSRLLRATERIEEALSAVRFNVDMRLLLDTTLLDIATTLRPL
jgi:DNA polymerase III delta prime subunit